MYLSVGFFVVEYALVFYLIQHVVFLLGIGYKNRMRNKNSKFEMIWKLMGGFFSFNIINSYLIMNTTVIYIFYVSLPVKPFNSVSNFLKYSAKNTHAQTRFFTSCTNTCMQCYHVHSKSIA